MVLRLKEGINIRNSELKIFKGREVLIAGTEAPDHQVGRQLVDPAGVQLVGSLVGEPQ